MNAAQLAGVTAVRMKSGTPFCITVDSQTLEDQTVTLRDRDTTHQERLAIHELSKFLEDHIDSQK